MAFEAQNTNDDAGITFLDTKPSFGPEHSDLVFEMTYVQCLAAGSYVVGHNGVAVVIDPLRDVDRYLKMLDEKSLSLKAVLLSHTHADYVSGHRELGKRAGAAVVNGAANPSQYDRYACQDGDTIALSNKYVIACLETPGHTPGCITYVLRWRQDGGTWKDLLAFTGDTLFIGSCGRPDLVAGFGHSKDKMASLMFDSLARLKTLDDDVLVLPAHGAGSPCGKAMSNDLYSTVGVQKMSNPALQITDRAKFVEWLIGSASTIGLPPYFAGCVATNLEGAPDLIDDVSVVPKVSLVEFSKMREKFGDDAVILDVRDADVYATSHLRNSINAPLGVHGGEVLSAIEGNFSMWIGTVVDPSKKILLVAPAGKHHEVLERLGRIGYAKKVAALLLDVGEIAPSSPTSIASIERFLVRDDDQVERSGVSFIDVRTSGEFGCVRRGRVEGAVNLPLSDDYVAKAAGVLDKSKHYVAYCASGFRSTLAASLLRSGGYNVTDCLGGYDASLMPRLKRLRTGPK